MSRQKKHRDSAAPRGSTYIDGQLIHMATQQKLFFQTHVCTINRETLKPGVPFRRADAERFMEKNLKKRQAHGIGNILEDRFTIEKHKSGGKDPFRSWVGYNEIVAIQRSKSKAEFFVLSVDSKSGQNYYEVYKCKTKEDAYKFESYIKQAMEDAEHRVRDGPAIAVVSVVEDPDLRRSMVHIDFQTSQDSLDEDYRTSTVFQNTSPTPPAGYSTPPKARTPSPVPVPQVVYQPTVRAEAPRPPSPRRSPSPRPTKTINGLNDVTYIKYDPRTHYPRASLDGPIYMYLQRHENKYKSDQRRYNSTDLSYGTYQDGYSTAQYRY
ncbi:hypothetical protein T265_08367 [Opisthorchis viverrini]|uniref:Trematode PH-like domain-containing protein n=1 Tax=Opisthorchis viverrini TaxID=6198 RepID=A0A074Z9A9_OPIVI|nr:hypothetical protein T265_08367 [Opisthorchis viverrini]KER23821.1 hypothetical protein T265_08367 [Opisthorchis viverrini]